MATPTETQEGKLSFQLAPPEGDVTDGINLTLTQLTEHFFPEGYYPPARQMENIFRFCNSALSQVDTVFYMSATQMQPFINKREFESNASPIFTLYTYPDFNTTNSYMTIVLRRKESVIKAFETLSRENQFELEELNPALFGLFEDTKVYKIPGDKNNNMKSPLIIVEDDVLFRDESAVTIRIAVEADSETQNGENYILLKDLFTIQLKPLVDPKLDLDFYLYPDCYLPLIKDPIYYQAQMVWDPAGEEPSGFISADAVRALRTPIDIKNLREYLLDKRLNRYGDSKTERYIMPKYYLELFTMLGNIAHLASEGFPSVISDRTLKEFHSEFERLDEVFESEFLLKTISVSISPTEYLMYELLLRREDIWKELNNFTRYMTESADNNHLIFWQFVKSSGLYLAIPALREIYDYESFEKLLMSSTDSSLSGIELFCDAFNKSIGEENRFKRIKNESTIDYWSRIVSLLPGISPIRDNRPARGFKQTDLLSDAKGFYTSEYVQPAIEKALNNPKKGNTHRNNALGYDAQTAQRYTEEMDALLAEVGSMEQKILLEMLGGNLTGKKILDAACGSGNEVNLLLENGADVYGFDASSEMINPAVKKYPGLRNRLEMGDLTVLPYKNESFDIIISKYALNEIDDVAAAIQEFSRCLKPGGTLIFFAHHPMSQMAFSDSPNDYFGSHMVNVKLNKDLVIKEPQHQLRQYLAELAKYFILEVFDEGQDPALRIHPDINYPEMMVVRAVKR